MQNNEKTDLQHWESAWSGRPRLRFPSTINIGTKNIMCLLNEHIQPKIHFIEIGCAPGKILSWVGKKIGEVPVCGIDYSPTGVNTTQWLCDALKIKADIRCEDAMKTTFQLESFNLVFSCGLIEHFEDPTEIINAHINLLLPGGTALIAIPKYSGIYLFLQKWCDPENLTIHNLNIMNVEALKNFAPENSEFTSNAFYYGNFSPWLVSLSSKIGIYGKFISWFLNFIAHLQPFKVDFLSPLVVLVVHRKNI